MIITKQAVQEVLEGLTVPGEGQNLVSSGALKNINVFGDEVVIDLVLKNPSLQARKKVEVEILKSIHAQIHQKAKITTNVKVESPPKKEAPIKGQPIEGISSIIAISSGKGGVGKSTRRKTCNHFSFSKPFNPMEVF